MIPILKNIFEGILVNFILASDEKHYLLYINSYIKYLSIKRLDERCENEIIVEPRRAGLRAEKAKPTQPTPALVPARRREGNGTPRNTKRLQRTRARVEKQWYR